MALQACGLNYKTAPVALRELFAFDAPRSQDLLRSLVKQSAINGAVLLSTCNRTEVYLDADTDQAFNVTAWLAQQVDQPLQTVSQHFYTLENEILVQHLLRVASGLDSMVLGEPQIFGQLKSAYALAEQTGVLSHALKQLFPAIFSGGKHIRTETNLGKCPVSVAYMAVKLIKAAFDDLSTCRVLLIGSGEMMELVATHLQAQAVSNITIVGRRHAIAETLARSFNAQARAFAELPDVIFQSDIIISATASPTPIIDRAMLAPILAQRTHRPLFIADLAVPRDVSADIAQLDAVSLYNIDDLQQIVQSNISGRAAAVEQAEAMIALHADNFYRRQRVAESAHVISQYRDTIDSFREAELLKATRLLNNGHAPEAVLRQFSYAFMNKVLHGPTAKLRDFASEDRHHALTLMKEFFETESSK